MSDAGALARLAERSLREHAAIRLSLDRLLGALGGLVPEGGDVSPMRRLAAEIEGLIARLREHFEGEEEGGLFRSLADADEAIVPEVRRLSDQHARLIEILEAAGFHAARGDAADAAPLKEDLEGFLAVIAAHESAEEALVRRALSG
jgi:hypothetical protein